MHEPPPPGYVLYSWTGFCCLVHVGLELEAVLLFKTPKCCDYTASFLHIFKGFVCVEACLSVCVHARRCLQKSYRHCEPSDVDVGTH